MHKSTSEYSFSFKWSHLISKHSHHTNPNGYRRPSQCSDQSVSSTTSSSSSSSSNSKTWDKWLGRFKHHRRRGSSGQNSSSSILFEEEEQDKKDEQQQQRLDQLYQTALDDLSYAEDSHGSRYYAGDVASAKESLDTCAQALLEIMMTNECSHSHLYTTMAPRLLLLQSRFDALPSLHH
ncbi:hypothetical protein BCR42DRAFT_427226, partial [Absidia repens]